MKLGILSDSHDRAARTLEAVRALKADGAELLIHLGDVESIDVLDALAGHQVHLVFGNCDWDTAALGAYAQQIGLRVDHPIGELESQGRHIAFTHGHIERLMQDALAREVDYLLHGHTHEARDERIGRTRVINPGALFRARRYTVASLDTKRDEVRFIEL